MPTFLAGLILGAISGGGTWIFTHDSALSALVAAAVAVCCWLGIACVLFLDD